MSQPGSAHGKKAKKDATLVGVTLRDAVTVGLVPPTSGPKTM